MKVLIIGLDGADPDFIEKNKSRLRNISGIIDKGISGKLRSVIPPLTGPAWTSFMTGVNPGKHGVHHFISTDINSGEEKILNSEMIKDSKKLWDILGENQKKVTVINVPVTYPPYPVNGYMVTGMLTPDESCEFTYPKTLKSELKDYRIFVDWMDYSNLEKFLSDLYDVTDKRVSNALMLMNRPWDFFMLVFSGTDVIQHFLFKEEDHENKGIYDEAILKYFMFIDEKIGELKKKAGADVVLLMSDHGFGKIPKKAVNLNVWLEKKGLLVSKKKTLDMKGVFFEIAMKFRKLRSIAPKSVKRVAKPPVMDIDWPKTKAHFSKAWINVGYIKLSQKDEELRNRIISELETIEDSGKRVIDSIYKKGDIYSGRHLDEIPDIVFLFSDDYTGSLKPVFIEEIPKDRRPAGHRINGFFAISGEKIKRAKTDASIMDIAPTVLDLFGIEKPGYMDGKALDVRG